MSSDKIDSVINTNINSAEAIKIGDVPSAVTSKMAFRILYEADDNPGEIPVRARYLYTDKSIAYNQDVDFMTHETSILLDLLVESGSKYGIITFKAAGKAGPAKMVDQVRYLRKHGWVTPELEKFRCIYAHINGDDGFMLFISVNAGIDSIEQLGLTLTSSGKTPKRVQRNLAAYMFMYEAKLLTSYKSDTGTVYECLLPSGKLFRVLDFNMALLDAGLTAFVDGSGHCSLAGFDGCTFSMMGRWGSNKGVYSNNPFIQDYEVVNYGSKPEMAISNGQVYIGVLSMTGLHDLWIDPQTLLNSGGYEENICVKWGMDMIDKMSAMAFSDNEDDFVDYFARLVNVSDEARVNLNEPELGQVEWSMIRAMKLCHESKPQPVFFRRGFSAIMKFAVDTVKGRIFVESGCRLYARPYPNMFHANGMPDRKLDNLSGKLMGLPCVCMMDVPEGETLILRNPNTNRHEMILVWNIHLEECVQYKGMGWCFFGMDAGELLSQLNGGDMDDNLVVITDPAFIAKWATMVYPKEPKIKPQIRKDAAGIWAHREHLLGIGKNWSFQVFNQQLEQFLEYSDSLGSFVNDGMLDSSISGEHKEAILECLLTGTYTVPDNFRAPTKEDLEKILLKSLWCFIPADYQPDLKHYVDLCKEILMVKPDFICARAMSNSDLVIDMLQQGTGDRTLVSKLIAEAKEARKTLFFPDFYKRRMPGDRVKAGNYILVTTKMCRALNALTEHNNQVTETSRQFEHLLTRQLHPRLLAAYPADDSIVAQANSLKTWWRERWQSVKDAGGLSLSKDIFKKISMGYETGEGAKLTRIPGLWDLYFFNSDNLDGTAGAPLTVEVRRKVGIQWLASVYARKMQALPVAEDGFTQSVSDGVPNFILDDILSAEDELGLTGLRVFIKLNHYAKSKLRKQASLGKTDKIPVWSIEGQVCACSNDRLLSSSPDSNLPDGNWMMSMKGVIMVRDSAPELHSDYKSKMALLDPDAYEGEEGN